MAVASFYASPKGIFDFNEVDPFNHLDVEEAAASPSPTNSQPAATVSDLLQPSGT